MTEAAFFKEEGGTGYVKAEGHMTALLCPGLKSRIMASLESASPPASMVFDLSACEYMDSTFLGLIVGVCKRLAAAGKPKPRLHGVNDACQGLLRTIGVLGMVELSKAALPPLAGMERIEGGPKASARFILDAHEDLSALSPENKNRFAGLNAALRGAIEGEEKK